MKFSAGFDAAFYRGGGTSAEIPGTYPVAINGRPYLLDLTQYERATIPLLRPSVDDVDEAGEQSLNNEGMWRRSASHFWRGAGQTNLDLKDTDARDRFFESIGVNPWNEGEFTLHNSTTRLISSVATNLRTATVNTYFVYVDGSAVKYTTDLITNTAFTGLSGSSVTGFTDDGTRVYISDGSNVYRGTPGTAAVGAAFSTYDADRVWYCNGRLLASNENELAEIAADGTATAIYTHFNANFDWVDAIGTPNGIYITGTAGNKSEIFYIGVDATTGDLATPIIATPWITNETINCIRHYGGVLFLGTSKGFRLALITGNNFLSYGSVVLVGPVYSFVFEENFAWFTYTDMASGKTGLGRINTDLFTDQERLVLAYATDLYADTTGTSLDVAIYNDTLYFAISGSGIWGETTTKVATGYLDTGWIGFGTIESKVFINFEISHSALVGSVMVEMVTDVEEIYCGTNNTPGTILAGPFSLDRDMVSRARIRITLSRDASDTTLAPSVSHWLLRALPAATRVEEIIAPILMHDSVKFPRGNKVNYDTLAEFNFLKTLEHDAVPVIYQEGDTAYQVRIDRVQLKPHSWGRHSRFFNSVILVRLITVET